ncbi:MAG: LUD domain-containing protein [Hydrogenophilus sp.]|nr:LUD domain-containing protein [Hydrogenophilus sp.]
MTDPRTAILTAIRAARSSSLSPPSPLSSSSSPPPAFSPSHGVSSSLLHPPTHPRIPLTDPPPLHWERLWTRHAATLERLSHQEQLPSAVARWCLDHSLPPPTHISATLLHLSWPSEWSLTAGPASSSTLTTLTDAYAAVAEIGAVVLLTTPDHPNTHNFLPENHLIHLSQRRILPHLEDLWALLRQEGYLTPSPPRTITLIAGPSRTGDIEQTLILGAHGPKHVHLFLTP